ncbi:MAG: DUF2730 family protein [Rhodanobacter sp.]
MTETVAVVIIALLLINLIGLLMVGVRVSGQDNDARELDQRLTRLEARVENLPTHRDLTDLGRAIAETAETVASISGQTQAMTQMLRTIQEHLLENDR